jgi:hypothetical protein
VSWTYTRKAPRLQRRRHRFDGIVRQPPHTVHRKRVVAKEMRRGRHQHDPLAREGVMVLWTGRARDSLGFVGLNLCCEHSFKNQTGSVVRPEKT